MASEAMSNPEWQHPDVDFSQSDRLDRLLELADKAPLLTRHTWWDEAIKAYCIQVANEEDAAAMRTYIAAVDPQTVKRLVLRVRAAEDLLRELEWAGERSPYPDGPRTCPVCFVDWNIDGVHMPDCKLLAGLRESGENADD